MQFFVLICFFWANGKSFVFVCGMMIWIVSAVFRYLLVYLEMFGKVIDRLGKRFQVFPLARCRHYAEQLLKDPPRVTTLNIQLAPETI